MGESDELAVDLKVRSVFLLFVLFKGNVKRAWALGDLAAESANDPFQCKTSTWGEA